MRLSTQIYVRPVELLVDESKEILSTQPLYHWRLNKVKFFCNVSPRRIIMDGSKKNSRIRITVIY